MAQSGIARIDNLLAGTGAPIAAGEGDQDAVALVQDLLRGHGYRRMPVAINNSLRKFGPLTGKAVAAFRRSANLPDGATVDTDTLTALVSQPASEPIASRGYITLVLGLAYSSVVKLVSLVAVSEGAGRFQSVNRNTDTAGLSLGIIQWAQKPGSIHELLDKFENGTNTASNADKQPDLAHATFGGATQFAGLQTFTGGAKGGVSANGETTNPAFNLIREPWLSRFKNACLTPQLQIVQVNAAVDRFAKAIADIKSTMPKIVSERGFAVVLDLTNQFYITNVQSIYSTVQASATSEKDLLEKIRDESSTRLQTIFKAKGKSDQFCARVAAAGRARRQFLLDTDLVTNNPFP